MQQDSEKEPKRKADGKVARLVDFGHVKINKGWVSSSSPTEIVDINASIPNNINLPKPLSHWTQLFHHKYTCLIYGVIRYDHTIKEPNNYTTRDKGEK